MVKDQMQTNLNCLVWFERRKVLEGLRFPTFSFFSVTLSLSLINVIYHVSVFCVYVSGNYFVVFVIIKLNQNDNILDVFGT